MQTTQEDEYTLHT